MAARKDSKGRSKKGPQPPGRRCPRCGGTGKVAGVVDDVEFEFTCTCSGGNEEAIRWLLGTEYRPARRKAR
jgi:hypothetical protein